MFFHVIASISMSKKGQSENASLRPASSAVAEPTAQLFCAGRRSAEPAPLPAPESRKRERERRVQTPPVRVQSRCCGRVASGRWLAGAVLCLHRKRPAPDRPFALLRSPSSTEIIWKTKRKHPRRITDDSMHFSRTKYKKGDGLTDGRGKQR